MSGSEPLVSMRRLMELEKSIGADAPIRLGPFLNDPLAFLDEEDMVGKVNELKRRLMGKDASVIRKLDENLSLLLDAKRRRGVMVKRAVEIFPEHQITCRGAFYGKGGGVIRTLWLEIYKRKGNVEMAVQMHVDKDMKVEWEQVLFLSRSGRIPSLACSMKSMEGWNFREYDNPEGRIYIMERVDCGNFESVIQETADELKGLRGWNER